MCFPKAVLIVCDFRDIFMQTKPSFQFLWWKGLNTWMIKGQARKHLTSPSAANWDEKQCSAFQPLRPWVSNSEDFGFNPRSTTDHLSCDLLQAVQLLKAHILVLWGKELMCVNCLDKCLHRGNTLLMLVVILHSDSITLHDPVLKQCLRKCALLAKI